jgi:hypothetical protein
MVSFVPLPLHPRRKSPRYPFYRRLGGPQSRSGRRGKEKFLDPTGTRIPTPRSLGRPTHILSLYREHYSARYMVSGYTTKLNHPASFQRRLSEPNFIKILRSSGARWLTGTLRCTFISRTGWKEKTAIICVRSCPSARLSVSCGLGLCSLSESRLDYVHISAYLY